MDIEFEGQYNQEEYLRAVKIVITPPRRATIIRSVIFAAMLILLIVIIVSGVKDGTVSAVENNRIRLSLFATVALGIYLATPYLGINSTAKRLWSKPSVQQARTGKVSPEGIAYGDKLKTWDSFIRKYVTGDMVLLLTADEGMSLLPKHFFRDDMDWKRFLQMVEQYAVNAKVKK
jgi:hypothetical protein